MTIIDGIRYNGRIYSHHGNETASTKGYPTREQVGQPRVFKPVGLILTEGAQNLLSDLKELHVIYNDPDIELIDVEVPDDWDDRDWS